MAQKRLVDKKISVSEQVSNLHVEAQLIFTWMILHADDAGLLPYSARTLKGLVVPLLDMDIKTFGNHMESIHKQKLIEIFKWKNEKYWKLPKFSHNQIMKKDRNPQTFLDIEMSKNAKISWETLLKVVNGNQMESNGFQMEVNGNQMEHKKTVYGKDGIQTEDNGFQTEVIGFHLDTDRIGKDRILYDRKESLESNGFQDVSSQLKNWNERQPRPIADFKAENIVKKYGAEKVAASMKEFGGRKDGFNTMLNMLKSGP